MSSQRRPLGVTLIGILWVARGILSILIGVMAAAAVALVSIMELAPRLEPFVRIVGRFAGLFGIVMVLIGILQLLLAFGLLLGKYWAWLATLILEVIRIVTTLLTLPKAPFIDALQVLISVVIIAYLMQPHARAFFEQKLPPPPSYQPPPQVSAA